MQALKQFSLPLQGLDEGIQIFDFQIDNWFFKHFENSPIEEGKITVKLIFDKRPDMIVLTFDLEGTVLSTCDRCLDPFQLPIKDAQQLLVKYGLEEKEEAEVAYILKGTPELNVARYVYEYICLAVPISKYCTDSDDKDCNEEMTQYLDNESSSEEKVDNPIWDALKDIKKK